MHFKMDKGFLECKGGGGGGVTAWKPKFGGEGGFRNISIWGERGFRYILILEGGS